MIPKPKSCRINDETWKTLPFHKRLDIWVSDWLPMWVVEVVIASVFAAFVSVVVSGVIALAAWDPTWFWSITSRGVFGGFFVLFMLVFWSNRRCVSPTRASRRSTPTR